MDINLYDMSYDVQQLCSVPVIHLGRSVPERGRIVQTLIHVAVVSVRIPDKQFAVVSCVSMVHIE